jgi:phosphoglycerate dehydrogenase-like enzyme
VEFADIDRVLPDTDGLVLACPLTPETENLVDADSFRALKAGAVLVNVARGRVVDEQAMTAALVDGRLGGAALDVATVEPLPAGSALWDRDDVLISPHVGGASSAFAPRADRLVKEQLDRYASGAPLLNVVRG